MNRTQELTQELTRLRVKQWHIVFKSKLNQAMQYYNHFEDPRFIWNVDTGYKSFEEAFGFWIDDVAGMLQSIGVKDSLVKAKMLACSPFHECDFIWKEIYEGVEKRQLEIQGYELDRFKRNTIAARLKSYFRNLF